MKSPDRDAADDVRALLQLLAHVHLHLTNDEEFDADEFEADIRKVGAGKWIDTESILIEQRSELATLRRRVAEMEAHKTAMPVSGDSMYCGKCNQWLADGRRLLWHHASGKYYCIGCDPGSPPARKELAEVTIKDCPTCGGIHYGSHECPYISAACAVCGDDTILACSDCGINSAGKQSIHVCKKTECRDAHEQARHSQALPPGRNEG